MQPLPPSLQAAANEIEGCSVATAKPAASAMTPTRALVPDFAPM
jgi:hypothetical protein